MNEPVLDLRDVRKSYGRTEALKGISLTIAPGEIVGLLGPNGAGKSTLFQIAAGLFAPDAGEVRLFGMGYRTSSSAILSRLGVMFQARAIDLDMTVLGNLKFHGALFGLSGKKLMERIEAIAQLLEITDLLKRPVRTLSGGNQRRAEVARALLNSPDLLLMDEPSTGLDPTTRRLLVSHMQRVRDEHNTSILWATHIVEEVEHADRIALIVAGQIIRTGTPAELMAAAGTDTLTDAYIALTGAKLEAPEAAPPRWRLVSGSCAGPLPPFPGIVDLGMRLEHADLPPPWPLPPAAGSRRTARHRPAPPRAASARRRCPCRPRCTPRSAVRTYRACPARACSSPRPRRSAHPAPAAPRRSSPTAARRRSTSAAAPGRRRPTGSPAACPP